MTVNDPEDTRQTAEDRDSGPSEAGVRSDENAGQDVELKKVDPDQFHQLDRRVIRIWRIENLIWTSILFAGSFIGSSALGLFTGFPDFLVPLIWILFGFLFYFFSFWWPPRLYRSWSYFLDEKVIELRFGVVWQKSVLIPISRVQHVDLLRGPLERRYGLSSLEIHTAGTQNAVHKISGLEAAKGVELREQLVSVADLEANE